MADGVVGLQPDSTGKKVDTTELTVGANIVERQRVQLAGSNATDLVKTRGDGFLNVLIDPTTLLFDTHDVAPDTTNTWTFGGTVTPVYNGSSVSFAPGTPISASSWMLSKPTFSPGSSSFLIYSAVLSVDSTALTGCKRFAGLGIMASTPTMALPFTTAIVFEIQDTDGLLYAVTYSNSVRGTPIALSRPTDGGPHRYNIYHESSKIYFEIDGVTVATIINPTMITDTLSIVGGAFNGATALTTGAYFVQLMASVGDSGRNSQKISDGAFPWRVAKVSAAGEVLTSMTSALPAGANSIGSVAVRGLAITGTSGSIAAAGTGTIGPLDVSAAGNLTFVVKNTVAASAYAGAPVLVFEQSDDNVSWGPLNTTRADTGATASIFTLAPNTANGSLMFDAGMEGVAWARVRVTTGPTTNAMTIVMTPGGLAFSPSVSVSNTFVPIAPTQSATTAGTITTGTSIVGPINVSGYGLVSVVLTGTYSASVVFEGSMDGVTWLGVTGNQPTNGTNASGFSGPANSLQYVDIPLGAYTQFRVRTSVYVSGTGNVTIAAKAIAYSAFSSTVAQGTVPNGSPTYVNPVVMAGYDGTNARTFLVKPASIAATATDQALVVALSPNSPVTQAVITKGTQGTNGVTTQDLKDAGRSARNLTLDTYAVASTAETLMSMSASTDNGVVVANTTYTVTTGKRFRMQQIVLGLDTTTGNTTAANVVIRVRTAPSGAITVTSPLQFIVAIAGVGAANGAGSETMAIPDGWELPSGATIGFTSTCAGFLATTAAPKILISVVGYEY